MPRPRGATTNETVGKYPAQFVQVTSLQFLTVHGALRFAAGHPAGKTAVTVSANFWHRDWVYMIDSIDGGREEYTSLFTPGPCAAPRGHRPVQFRDWNPAFCRKPKSHCAIFCFMLCLSWN